MIFVTGPAFSGKKEWVCSFMGWSEEQFMKSAAWDVQNMASSHPDLEELADSLEKYPVVIAGEVGAGRPGGEAFPGESGKTLLPPGAKGADRREGMLRDRPGAQGHASCFRRTNR